MKHPRKVVVNIRRLHAMLSHLCVGGLECRYCELRNVRACKGDRDYCETNILKWLTGDKNEEFHEEDWSYKFYHGRKKLRKCE